MPGVSPDRRDFDPIASIVGRQGPYAYPRRVSYRSPLRIIFIGHQYQNTEAQIATVMQFRESHGHDDSHYSHDISLVGRAPHRRFRHFLNDGVYIKLSYDESN